MSLPGSLISGEVAFVSWVNFRCSTAQAAGSVSRSLRAAVVLVASVKVNTWAGGTMTWATILEPSNWFVRQGSVASCGVQQPAGYVLPAGVGFDDSIGLAYNLVDTGIGQCV